MLALLIVDDELIIADGLYHMLQERFQDQLIVRRCYSAAEASAVLEHNRIDILMTDIEMPGMTGLELHESVRERWPMIRVIYLTGYSDFDYARRALQQNALAYVLKNEGDQVIIAAVEKAIRSYEEETAKLLHRAVYSEQAQHLRQLVFHAMHGGLLQEDQLEWAVPDSGLSFSMDKQVSIGYCYFENAVPAELLRQSMNLIDHLTNRQIPMLLTDMNARSFSIVCQLRTEGEQDVLMGNLEAVQRQLEQESHRLTVCMLEGSVAWTELGTATQQLLEQMNKVSPAPGELVTLKNEPVQLRQMIIEPGTRETESIMCLQRMQECLMTGQKDLLEEEEERFWQLMASNVEPQTEQKVYEAINEFMTEISKTLPESERWHEDAAVREGRLSALRPRMDEIMQALLDAREEKQNHRQRRLVRQIDRYISEHLSGDLSLTAISDALHFHPTYISRMYKEFSNVSLSDAIALQRLNYACAMLRDTDQPISVIAAETGFFDQSHFTKTFKQARGITPSAYRKAHR